MVVWDEDIDLIMWNSLDDVKYIKMSSLTKEKWWFDKNKIIKNIQEFTKKWVDCYIWWWLFDSHWSHEDIKQVAKEMTNLWIKTVEITNSEWNLMVPTFFQETMNILRWEFEKVLIEIWTKNFTRFNIDYKIREKAIENAIENFADEIIVEWWWSWNVWIYDKNCKIKSLLLSNIIKKIEELGYKDKYIIESSLPTHQINITQNFWEDIQLWNILPLFYKYINSIRSWNISKEEFNKLKYNYQRLWLLWLFNIELNNQNNTTKNDFFWLINKLFELALKNNIDPNSIFFDEELYNINWDIKTTINRIKSKILELT